MSPLVDDGAVLNVQQHCGYRVKPSAGLAQLTDRLLETGVGRSFGWGSWRSHPGLLCDSGFRGHYT